MQREEAEQRTILRATVGSTLHGLNVPGKDDLDEMGILVEPYSEGAGLSTFDQFIYRTAAEREQKHDAPSQPGDLDLTLYSLRKYVRLALNGNPSVLTLMYAPLEMCSVMMSLGSQLREFAHCFVSGKAGMAHLGYLTAQKQRLLGERGGKKVRRPELESKFGYDTKYAMHMARLAYQGVELMSTGKITLPMPETERAFCFSVRQGEVPLNDVLSTVGELEKELKDLSDTGPFSGPPNTKTIEEFLIDTYMSVWSAQWQHAQWHKERPHHVSL